MNSRQPMASTSAMDENSGAISTREEPLPKDEATNSPGSGSSLAFSSDDAHGAADTAEQPESEAEWSESEAEQPESEAEWSESEAEQPDSEADSDVETVETNDTVDLRERQEILNKSHLFGIRIWKPALYKKHRSIEEAAEGDIHCRPGEHSSNAQYVGIILWVLLFGWWISLAFLVPALILLVASFLTFNFTYARLLFELSGYMLYPFGNYLEFIMKVSDSRSSLDNIAANEHTNDDLESELESLLFPHWSENSTHTGREFTVLGDSRNENNDSLQQANSRFFEMVNRDSDFSRYIRRHRRRTRIRTYFLRSQRLLYHIILFTTVAPILLLVSAICWLLIYPLPMAKICSNLVRYLRKFPDNLHFRGEKTELEPECIHYVLLCTKKATNLRNFKYTIDGINIFFVNLLFVAALTIILFFTVDIQRESPYFYSRPEFFVIISVISTIPLAYIVGQGVASISAQSSMGVGAVLNAFFGSVIDIYLNFSFLQKNKSRVVDGCLIGSIIAGTLLMPGLSMIVGAAKTKTQRFNLKSASVTSTMLLFAGLGCFAPSVFHIIYAPYQQKCLRKDDQELMNCSFSQPVMPRTSFFLNHVKPLAITCAVCLLLSYCIGLSFTLVTHAAIIWHPENVLDRSANSLSQPEQLAGINHTSTSKRKQETNKRSDGTGETSRTGNHISKREYNSLPSKRRYPRNILPELNPINGGNSDTKGENVIFGRSSEMNSRDHSRNASRKGTEMKAGNLAHDAPNWSRKKSTIILISGTTVFAIIAEISVRVVAMSVKTGGTNEKLLGLTLFALVPTATEILNAMLFAQQGNIALSLEIASAYVLQVILLQIPIIMFLSYVRSLFTNSLITAENTFSMAFPKWDVFITILSILLLSNIYSEGKSDYFKGSMLLLGYFVALGGFIFEPF